MKKLILFAVFMTAVNLFAETKDNLHAETHVFGGSLVSMNDPVAKSTVGFLSEWDDNTGFAWIDGSATLVAPNILVGAAHTCLNFNPTYAYFGNLPPDYGVNDPKLVEIVKCIAHPNYNSDSGGADSGSLEPAYDIAVFFIKSTPAGFTPAKILSPNQDTLPELITIAGFGAYEGQMDNLMTTGLLRYELRKVDSFITASFQDMFEFKDGPNPGKGTCQGDSGGPIYSRTNSSDTPILMGTVVRGPACEEGIGYNTDVRYFVNWIEQTAKVTLTKATVTTLCGNGNLDNGEFCDGNSKQCLELGKNYISGTASCNELCTGWDESNCVSEAGDEDIIAKDNDSIIIDEDASVITDNDTVVEEDSDIIDDSEIKDDTQNDDDFLVADKDIISSGDSDMIPEDDNNQLKDGDTVLATDSTNSNDSDLPSNNDEEISSDSEPKNSDSSGCSCSVI